MSQIYTMFKNSIANVVNKQQGENIQLHKLLELQAAFIKFCVHTFPDKIEYVDQILQLSVNLCGKVSPAEYSDAVLESIVQILIHPLETMSIVVLNLAEYPRLMGYLPFLKRKKVASKIVEAVVNSRTYIINTATMKKLVSFIVPLIEEQDDAVPPTQEEMEIDLGMVSRLIGFIESHDPQVTAQMLDLMGEKVRQLPVEARKVVLPALVTGYCRVARRVVEVKKFLTEEDAEEKIKAGYERVAAATYLTEAERNAFSFKIEPFEFNFLDLFTRCREQIDDIGIDFPKTSIKLSLQLALLVSEVDSGTEFDEFQGDLCSETLELFQDEIVNPKEKSFFLEFIIGTFCQINNLTPENRESLYRNTTTFASSLLKKKDKVLMLLKASSLYLRENYVGHYQPERRRQNQRNLKEGSQVREKRNQA